MTRNKTASIILIILVILSSVTACTKSPTEPSLVNPPTQETISPQITSDVVSTNQVSPESVEVTPGANTLTNVFPNLYDCDMVMKFTSGPLKGKKSRFTILGKDYFNDKGEQFFPGEKTAVYYEGPRYIILHSAFANGNILRPLEAEFIRYYLEYWGESGSEFIQDRINELIGSQIEWSCDGQIILNTEINSIIRLSATASTELWEDPIYLRQILLKHEGKEEEWIGDMDPYFMDTFFLGFCGWGPEESGDYRYYYYRYLINFDLL
jgi:hypothetical protein